MRYLILLIAFLSIALSGCSSLQPLTGSPSPIPEFEIKVPPYPVLDDSYSECQNRLCKTQLYKPILVRSDSRINHTTYENRRLPIEIPECPIVEVGYNEKEILSEIKVVNSPDLTNYFNLYYFIPLKSGSHTIKLKSTCEIRGTFYTISVE